MSYFLITCGEDGIRVSGPVDDDAIINSITSDEEGHAPAGYKMQFVDRIPKIDDGYFIGYGDANVAVIIRGEIVVPKPVAVVQKYEL